MSERQYPGLLGISFHLGSPVRPQQFTTVLGPELQIHPIERWWGISFRHRWWLGFLLCAPPRVERNDLV